MIKDGIVIHYVPKCEANGDFKPMQCPRGACKCVYANGTTIPGYDGNYSGRPTITEELCANLRKGEFLFLRHIQQSGGKGTRPDTWQHSCGRLGQEQKCYGWTDRWMDGLTWQGVELRVRD